jgi:hypothetical protein
LREFDNSLLVLRDDFAVDPKRFPEGDLAEMVRKVLDEIAESLSANEAGQADAGYPGAETIKGS